MNQFQPRHYSLDMLPEDPAVYLIYRAIRKFDGTPDNLYVGETDNIRQCTKEHLSDLEANIPLKEELKDIDSIVLKYDTMYGSNKEERKSIEKDWIDRYHPKHNVQK